MLKPLKWINAILLDINLMHMENPKSSIKNPLRLIVNTTIAVFIIILLAFVGAQVGLSLLSDDSDNFRRIELLTSFSESMRILAIYVFDFIQPFLQLILILTILEWLLNKFGIPLNKSTLKFDWNAQTLIGIVVIVAFSLAALSGVAGASMLKDVALVVVGFYFGTQKRTNEIIQGDTKISSTEDHTNER